MTIKPCLFLIITTICPWLGSLKAGTLALYKPGWTWLVLYNRLNPKYTCKNKYPVILIVILKECVAESIWFKIDAKYYTIIALHWVWYDVLWSLILTCISPGFLTVQTSSSQSNTSLSIRQWKTCSFFKCFINANKSFKSI